jgi:hypothetical protein
MTETYIIRPDNNAALTVKQYIDYECREGEWEVTIKPYKKNKTRAQERYFHKLVDIICAFNGDNKKDMKRRIAWNCHLREEFVTDEGEVMEVPMHTTGLKVKQYSDIIEAAQMLCMLLGLKYPAPDPDRGYAA